MLRYIQRRLVLAIPLLLGITIVSYVIISVAPGDPFSALIDPSAEVEGMRSHEELEALKKEYGLDRPVLIRYFYWLKEVAQGNLGFSIHSDRPVAELVLSRLPATLVLTVSSTALAMTIGVILGVLSALRQYTVFDYLMTAVAFLGISIPSFFIAMISIYIFGVKLQWLPIYGMWTPGEPATALDFLRHAVMPVMALSVVQIAGYMRYARASTLDALAGDHITTARAKGLREVTVLWVHVFRNALIPLVTIAGLQLPDLIGGSFIIESIFSWPGIGMLAYEAIRQRDYPIQIGVALIAAVAVLVANLLTDIVYGFVDPRIRYE